MNRVIRKLKHTGSKPGKLNGWDRAKASITGSIWVATTEPMRNCDCSIDLLTFAQSWPAWVESPTY